jgi:probable HAF family extracellular repeat protein
LDYYRLIEEKYIFVETVMNTRPEIRILVAICLAFGMLLSLTDDLWAMRYRYQDLGALGGNYSYARAINNNGQVVGRADTSTAPDAPNARAFLWTPSGGMQNLGAIGTDTYSEANGINDYGQVAGRSSGATDHAFLWTAAAGLQDLTTLPNGTWAGANAINNGGQVVGVSDIVVNGTHYYHAFVWTAGEGMQDLAMGGNTATSEARAINLGGQIVGTYSPPFLTAFLWTGILTDLGTLGGNIRYAYGINNSKQIVGWSQTSDVFYDHAFLWDKDNKMQDLGGLPGAGSPSFYSHAYGINDFGQVVGDSNPAPGPIGGDTHAIVWTAAAGMQDLNDLLINPPTGQYLRTAYAINNKGQIAGVTGGIKNDNYAGRAFLLTPVDNIAPVINYLL